MSDIISPSARRCSRCDVAYQCSGSSTSSYCSSCYSQYRKDRYAKGIGVIDPDRARDANLRRNYGITAQQYDQMLTEQNGVCAVCKQPETRIEHRSKAKYIRYLSVDHDHETGEVRALLCHECNAALGLLREDPQRAQALLTYIIEKCK